MASPTDPKTMYAGSANGGVWKTTDDGVTWVPITDAIAYLSIGAIAINPTNSNEIWIGTGDVNISGSMYTGNGVYRSLDAGQTWTYLGLSDSYVVSSIVFNSSNTKEVLIGTMGNPFTKTIKRGIYKTSNSGSSFSNTLFINDSTGIIDMVGHSTNSSIVYASSYTRIRSERVSSTLGTENNVYKSTDFGQTWTKLAGGLPNGSLTERLGIAICKSTPSTLYALYSSSDGTVPKLYKTVNDGATWQLVTSSGFNTGSYGSFGWYFGKIFVDPNNANRIYIPGISLQASSNGGSTWSSANGNCHADGHWIHFRSSTELIYCNDGGMNRSTNSGSSWTDIENIPVNQFYAITENQNKHGVYAGGVQDNGTEYGNGATMNSYIRLYGGDGFTVEYTPSTSLIYAESQNGAIVYDNAFPSGNWKSIQKDNSQNYNWHTPYFISKSNSSILFFGGQKVNKISAAPGGAATAISPVLNDPSSPVRVCNISTIGQSILNASILYAGTADGKVWNTLNGGTNWKDITPFQGLSFYVTKVMPSPNAASTAYVTRSGYRSNDNTPLIFKTVNDGTTWTNITGDLPLLAVNDIEIYPGKENIIFIANDAGVYYTTNSGVNWLRLGNNMPYVPVFDVDLNYNNSRLIAGTFGRSIYTMDVSLAITVNLESLPNHSLQASVYPNPFSSQANFSVNEYQKNATLKIYSLTGQLIKNINFSGQQVVFEKENLESGIYFYQISSENKTLATGKIIAE